MNRAGGLPIPISGRYPVEAFARSSTVGAEASPSLPLHRPITLREGLQSIGDEIVMRIGLAHSKLTRCSNTSKLVRMVFARPILPGVLTVALLAYAVDCGPTASAEQAMQCCNSMRCMSSHHHRGEECCKAMATGRVVIGQPTSGGISLPSVVFAAVQVFSGSAEMTASARIIADQSHAPPVFRVPTILPLRI